VSVQIVILATGVDQLQNIHQSLLRYEAVKMVI
jgi:putative lipoic acid-binding regulatory protein